jgi:glycosyltransferase involved in cell wall biosynthesis
MQLVYLSPVPWVSFAQRPHKFVEWFRRACGGQVLWIDPYPTRLPSWQDFSRKSDGSSSAIEALADGISVLRPRALPIEPLPWSGAVNRMIWADVFQAVNAMLSTGPTMLGIGKPSELALRLISAGGFTHSFYDAMDDFPAFYHGLSRFSMAKRESKVVDRVSKILVSSTELLSRWKANNSVLLARNACDTQMLPPINLLEQQNRQNILGYVGTIAHWFDWELVIAIARAKPNMRVQLIGPVFGTIPANLPKNIELFPPCTHTAAITAMQSFAVGLIPFQQARLTKSVDPIKYYEYRAMGLPVISSAFGEMRFHQNDVGVFLLDQTATVGEVNSVIDAALTFDTVVSEVQDFRTANSWEVRFAATGLI